MGLRRWPTWTMLVFLFWGGMTGGGNLIPGAATPAIAKSSSSHSDPKIMSSHRQAKAPESEDSASGDQDQPREPLALLNAARLQAQQGRITQCCHTYLRFINLYPAHPEYAYAFVGLAEALARLGHRDAALQGYRLAALESRHPRVAERARLGMLTVAFYRQLDQGAPMPALKHYLGQLADLEELIQTSPEDRDRIHEALTAGWEVTIQQLTQKSPVKVQALEEALEVWALTPHAFRPPTAALRLGELLLSKSLYLAAQKYLQPLVLNENGSIRRQALYHLVEIYWELQHFDHLEKLLAQWPIGEELPPALLARLGQVQLKNGKPNEAVKTLSQALRHAAVKESLEYWRDLARAYHLTGQEKLARETLHRALEAHRHTSRSEPLPWQVARLYFLLGHFRQAAQAYQQLRLEQVSESDAAFYLAQLGQCYLQTRQYRQAEEIFQELAQRPENFWQDLARINLSEIQRLIMESKEGD